MAQPRKLNDLLLVVGVAVAKRVVAEIVQDLAETEGMRDVVQTVRQIEHKAKTGANMGTSSFQLEADSFRKLQFTVPSGGKVSYNVNASGAVSTYVLDTAGIKAFEQGEDIPALGGFGRKLAHKERLTLEHEGRWYLVVSNRGSKPVDVFYEVKS